MTTATYAPGRISPDNYCGPTVRLVSFPTMWIRSVRRMVETYGLGTPFTVWVHTGFENGQYKFERKRFAITGGGRLAYSPFLIEYDPDGMPLTVHRGDQRLRILK